jgi:hypothetical protein
LASHPELRTIGKPVESDLIERIERLEAAQ